MSAGAGDLRSVSSVAVEVASSTEAETPPAAVRNGRPAAVCPHFHAAIELIGKRWTGAILCALIEQPRRYGELGRAVPGLSDRLLSQRLRELETEGLVEREVEAGTPVRVTYSLTERGYDLRPVIRELRVWANRWTA